MDIVNLGPIYLYLHLVSGRFWNYEVEVQVIPLGDKDTRPILAHSLSGQFFIMYRQKDGQLITRRFGQQQGMRCEIMNYCNKQARDSLIFY